MSSLNGLLSLGGWYFLPNLVTGWLQSAFYAIFIRAGDPKPAPGSPRFVRDRRRVHIFVIVVYLLYTIYDADWQLRQAGDFYQDLGVPHDVSIKAVQSRFRRLNVKYHPDKFSVVDRPAAEVVYNRLNTAKDILADPAKRFAYDRFGPDMLDWKRATTIYDHVSIGLRNHAMYYGGTAFVLVLLGWLDYLPSGKFWRFQVMAALFVIEIYTTTRPEFPPFLSRVINPILVATKLRPPYLPFQMLTLLRKLAVTSFIAMSQLGPLLNGPQTAGSDDDTVPAQVLDRVDAVTQANDQEIARLLGLELAPFATDEASMRALRASTKEWLVQNTIRNDPEVKTAVNQVFERRRRDGSYPNVAFE